MVPEKTYFPEDGHPIFVPGPGSSVRTGLNDGDIGVALYLPLTSM
jgi:hypothetical protein